MGGQMQKPETKYKKKLTDKLKLIPNICIIVKEAGAIVGWPDLLLCVNGVFVGAEIKIPPNKTTKMQERRLKQIANAGGRSFVVTPDTEEKFLYIIKMIALYGR